MQHFKLSWCLLCVSEWLGLTRSEAVTTSRHPSSNAASPSVVSRHNFLFASLSINVVHSFVWVVFQPVQLFSCWFSRFRSRSRLRHWRRRRRDQRETQDHLRSTPETTTGRLWLRQRLVTHLLFAHVISHFRPVCKTLSETSTSVWSVQLSRSSHTPSKPNTRSARSR